MHDARLCSAELLVMRGDLEALNDPQTPAVRRRGLQNRLTTALGTLRWLCRRAAAVRGIPSADITKPIGAIRQTFEAGDLARVARQLDALINRLPLSIANLQPESASSEAVETGGRIYQRYCAGCHTHPDRTSENPADSLFAMAQRQPLDEFLARMLVGVHGTPEISLRNPLSDRDIAGMTVYLRSWSTNPATSD